MIGSNETKIQNQDDKVSRAFVLSHATSINGGFMMVAATLGTYFSVYMTDTVGIPAATASAIMFIATLWDAINDPIMGMIADRTNTRWGRYRPYFTIFPVLMLIVVTLIFYNPPGLSMNQKIIYVGGIYICYGMLTTILTMPQMAILPTVTRDNEQRNKVVAAGAGVCAFSFTVAATFTPQLTGIFGGNYVPLMFIYGVLGVISFWGLFVTSKEKYLPKVEKRPITHDLKRLFRHKELFPILLVWCLAALGYGLMFSASVYYMMYYLARPDLISVYMGVISIGALISMVVLMPIALKIFKTGQKALIVTQGISFVLYGLLFFFGKNLTFLFVVSFLATCIASMGNALVNVLVNDVIDFIQLKEGVALNGTIAAVKGFSQKCGNTVTNSGILAVLAITGYIAGAIGQQPETAMLGINFLRFGAPAITAAVVVLCLKFYPIEKYYGEIEEMKSKMTAND